PEADHEDRLVLPPEERFRALLDGCRDALHLGRPLVGGEDLPREVHRERERENTDRHDERSHSLLTSPVEKKSSYVPCGLRHCKGRCGAGGTLRAPPRAGRRRSSAACSAERWEAARGAPGRVSGPARP